MDKKGYFITFEGIDGCGKTTQLEAVCDFLSNLGYECVKTREPGSLELGKKIREILLHHDGIVSDNCEMFLFLADRSQHIDTLIKPSVDEGKIVLCDRHTDSTIAYQGYGREHDIERLIKLNEIATNGIKPDLTFVFDVSCETGAERAGNNPDRMELSGKEFFERVRKGYLKLAKRYPDRIKVINGEKSKELVYNEVKSHIINLMDNKRNKRHV